MPTDRMPGVGLGVVDVGIVGAGPVGLAAANLLGTYGVSCVVYERRDALSNLPRAILLDDESLRTLQALSLDQSFLPKIRRGEGARYYDEQGAPFADVGPGPKTYGFPKRSHFFQPDLEATLLEGLDRFRHCHVCFKHEVVELEQSATEVALCVKSAQETLTTRCRFVLGCDGANSFIRRKLGIEMQGSEYPEDWLIFDMENDPDLEPVSKFYCREQRPYVSVVGPGEGRRYEIRARPQESTEEFKKKLGRLDTVRALLKGIREVNEGDVKRSAIYRFEAKVAAKWQDGRVFLVGDAAHLTPPFAGQGLNAGIRDAFNIAWKIAMVVRMQASPKVLTSYQIERYQPALAMVQLAVAMGKIVMPDDTSDVQFRQKLMELLNMFPAAKEFIVGMKFKPQPMYEAGVLIKPALHEQFAGYYVITIVGSLVGAMLPQPAVRRHSHDSAGIPRAASDVQLRLDSALGSGFAILVQDPKAVEIAKRLWPELEPTVVLLSDEPSSRIEGPDEHLAPDWSDEDIGSAMPLLRAHRDQLLLVRPDRFVAMAFSPDSRGCDDAMRKFREVLGVQPAASKL